MIRTEWGAALIASVLANSNRGKNTPPFHISDFAPHIDAKKPISLEDAKIQWT